MGLNDVSLAGRPVGRLRFCRPFGADDLEWLLAHLLRGGLYFYATPWLGGLIEKVLASENYFHLPAWCFEQVSCSEINRPK